MNESRRTVSSTETLEGVGLHLGVECRLTFTPAERGSGIAFRRSDRDGAPVIPATVESAQLSERRTQLGTGDDAVHTVEHVLAAVGALRIDDITIDLSGPEPPILDGSAEPFLAALQRAGIREHGGTARYLELSAPVEVIDGKSRYYAEPSESLELDVMIEFPHPLIGVQRGRWTVNEQSFTSELARARTFGFVHEVEMLRSRGLIRGASTQNAVVLDDSGVVGNELRWPDEFVRHKALDCVGDLCLAGRRVRAKVSAERPSHRGTVMLVREMVTRARKES